jgi:hypothetical protein
MIEFEDAIPDADVGLVPDFARAFLWDRWDAIKQTRVKMRWGPLRPSFRLYVFEPVVVKLIGPRPTA